MARRRFRCRERSELTTARSRSRGFGVRLRWCRGPVWCDRGVSAPPADSSPSRRGAGTSRKPRPVCGVPVGDTGLSLPSSDALLTPPGMAGTRSARRGVPRPPAARGRRGRGPGVPPVAAGAPGPGERRWRDWGREPGDGAGRACSPRAAVFSGGRTGEAVLAAGLGHRRSSCARRVSAGGCVRRDCSGVVARGPARAAMGGAQGSSAVGAAIAGPAMTGTRVGPRIPGEGLPGRPSGGS